MLTFLEFYRELIGFVNFKLLHDLAVSQEANATIDDFSALEKGADGDKMVEEMGLEPPTTWDEFLGVIDAAKEAGKTPITIGTQMPWTAAAWFDYLNMRQNGPEFHISLMDGAGAQEVAVIPLAKMDPTQAMASHCSGDRCSWSTTMAGPSAPLTRAARRASARRRPSWSTGMTSGTPRPR